MLQSDQIKGMTDRAIAILATVFLQWMVSKGWIGQSDVATFVPAFVLIPSLIWGWWYNRPKALLQSAASIPGTTVITDPKLANNTPEQNIISNDDVQVVPRLRE